MSSVMDLSRFEEYYNLMQSMCLGYEQMQTTRMLEFFLRVKRTKTSWLIHTKLRIASVVSSLFILYLFNILVSSLKCILC